MIWIVFVLVFASAITGLDITCSDTPLYVEYDIKYYNGKVNCGNVLLEADIGGGINVQPTVRFRNAKQDHLYTLLYVDPDANAGFWPDVPGPGSHAPVRHWVAGNIPANALLNGDLSSATQVQAFKGPSPPSGSHRYAQWLFEQPNGTNMINFAPMPDSIIQWDYEDFIASYHLGEPIASNWHVTQYAKRNTSSNNAEGLNDASSAVKSVSLVAGLDIKCSRTPLYVKYDIDYYSGTVNCGTLLLEADIGGGINVQPTVKFQNAKQDHLYTLLYVDPDANTGSWPDVPGPGSHAPVRHWVAGNIPASALLSGDLTSATQVQAFKGPSPPSGSHRYAQWLFEQPNGTNVINFAPMPDSIIQWDYEGFIANYHLGEPVASNWHVTQHMDARSAGVVV